MKAMQIIGASAVMGKLGGLRCIGKKLNLGPEFCISAPTEKNIHNTKNFPCKVKNKIHSFNCKFIIVFRHLHYEVTVTRLMIEVVFFSRDFWDVSRQLNTLSLLYHNFSGITVFKLVLICTSKISAAF